MLATIFEQLLDSSVRSTLNEHDGDYKSVYGFIRTVDKMNSGSTSLRLIWLGSSTFGIWSTTSLLWTQEGRDKSGLSPMTFDAISSLVLVSVSPLCIDLKESCKECSDSSHGGDPRWEISEMENSAQHGLVLTSRH